MFQFRRFPTYAYLIQRRLTEYCSAGFPHSVIHGSMDMCSSPWLIAACHDLLRLLMPRHSPCALISLTFVGAKSARLRFRRQPLASGENCARFLAPPLRIETKVSILLRPRPDALLQAFLVLRFTNYAEIIQKFSRLANCFYPF